MSKLLGKFKHELGSKVIDEFVTLSQMTYSFKVYPNKIEEKGIWSRNNVEHEEYFYALMYNNERTVEEYRIQKTGNNITLTKTSKIS